MPKWWVSRWPEKVRGRKRSQRRRKERLAAYVDWIRRNEKWLDDHMIGNVLLWPEERYKNG